MKLNFTTLSIMILFVCVIGLGAFILFRPVEVFEQKSPEDAYINWVSHTEYIAGDSFGQAIIRVSDYKGRPLNASCNITLVSPSHTYIFTDSYMSPSIIYGNYYKQFTVPNTFGIYTEFVNCSVQLNPSTWVFGSSSESIHVNPAFDFLVNISQNITYLQDYLENFTYDVNNNFTYIDWLISQINNTCGNVSVNCTANLNYTNQLIINSTNNITQNITNFRNEAYTWYNILRQDIYNVLQKWIDALNNMLPSNIIQKVPLGYGVTQTETPNLLKRIIGGD
jgi:hypothetical protein